MSFKIDDCAIPKVWCGRGAKPKRKKGDLSYYNSVGDRYECMQKGYGAGMHNERRENLPVGSLQRIKYVGEVYEKRFKKEGIASLSQLKSFAKRSSRKDIESTLKKVFVKKKGGLYKQGYNSTLVYLFQNGIGAIPACSKIT